MAGAAGTGDAPDSDAVGQDSGAPVAPALIEQYGDLHEYGLSLGVDLDHENEEDLAWAVREAFNAPLPSSWTEYMDDTGRAYYIKDGSSESTWEHPMDAVYRELLDLIKSIRQMTPPASEAQREEVVKQHLRQVHQRAKEDLAGWSGPYNSEQGEYYYSDILKMSSWDCPTVEWERELAVRHAVLVRYLLPEQATGDPTSPGGSGDPGVSGGGHHMLQALRLQLGNLQRPEFRVSADGSVPEPSTSRSYHTARSQGSSRASKSKHHRHETHRERKERKERKAAKESGSASPLASSSAAA
mmetsp:Transcript_6578/g.16436  ORF Transcript_6578/g.16436 Transcript_6578/m.16436 type:complete len:299 (+) Transcript_6578:82-978(+)